MPRRAPAAIDQNGSALPFSPTPDLATRVAAIEAGYQHLRDDIQQLRDMVNRLIAARRPLTDDAQLLAAIAHAVQDHVFTARELRNHAIVDANLRVAIGGANVRQLGKRLRRVAGQRIGPYRVLWADRDSDGNFWRLQVFND